MKVLVVGSGAREHALCWKISQSALLDKLWCAPGNPGIAQIAECVPFNLGNKREIVNFANMHHVDLVVVGPEGPLVDGLADDLEVFGIPCCGPNKVQAQLEGSKTYTKGICDGLGIPTAKWEVFTNIEDVSHYISTITGPIVVKADGLAAGKGVVIAPNQGDAIRAAMRAFEDHSKVIIEEYLTGIEASLFALCDGKTAVYLGDAQDYKRIYDGDLGPNTGGMGAVSPAPALTPGLIDQVWRTIIMPTVKATEFKGILFAGLMLTNSGPKLIEYNVRFGDPECQTILARLDCDLLPALYAAAKGRLEMHIRNSPIRFSYEDAVSVVMAAPGYPDAPEKGSEIRGLDKVVGAHVFHAGTALKDDKLVAAGGRVLTVTGVGTHVGLATTNTYKAVKMIDWLEGQFRSDIGAGLDNVVL